MKRLNYIWVFVCRLEETGSWKDLKKVEPRLATVFKFLNFKKKFLFLELKMQLYKSNWEGRRTSWTELELLLLVAGKKGTGLKEG